jgi:hypothetical protein
LKQVEMEAPQDLTDTLQEQEELVYLAKEIRQETHQTELQQAVAVEQAE